MVAALLLIAAQATAVLAAADDSSSSCLAQFITGQQPGGVADSILSNLDEAHPIGLNVISFTASIKAPCFEE
jgi:hypothetical protein